MKGFIVSAEYETIDDKGQIQLFGRLENNQSFVALLPFEPFFYLNEEFSLHKFPKEIKIEKTALKSISNKSLIKVTAPSQPALTKALDSLPEKTEKFESDLRPTARYLIENNILNWIDIEGDYITSEKIERVYNSPKVKPSEQFNLNLKIASIDLESSRDKNSLYCIGLTSKNKKQTFMVTEHKTLKNVIPCKDEEDCLEKFKKALLDLDPDIITGWNLISFDLVYLQNLFKKYKIQFDLGRTNDNLRLRIESNFFRNSSADCPGRQVLDALQLIKDPFIKEAPSIKKADFESYTLENVSQTILREGKLLKGKERHLEIEDLYSKNTTSSHQELADYNIRDCELVLQILEKTQMIELATERASLTGLQFDKLTGSIVAFDSLYIREMHKRDLVAPTTRFTKKNERITGGYVFSANPGIYSQVLVFDFKSLYPSIIRTFNIDPASFLDKKEKNCIEAPNGACFKNSTGILPELLTKLNSERDKAKKEKRELSSYAIKVIMNSFFGVLASPNCRFFNLDMANAITHFGRAIIQLTAKEVEKQGFKVIYQDTDSCFVETALEEEKAAKLGEKIEKDITEFYKEYTKKNYNRESLLELKFEKHYRSLLIPSIRQSPSKKDEETEEKDKAAKKRYAGLIVKGKKEELDIVGLEAIRGDWTDAAQEFQRELLLKVFNKEPTSDFIQKFISDLRTGKKDSQLVYRKSIRKPLDEYTKTTPPHVKAARLLPVLESNIIEYVLTENGQEPISMIKHKLDYEHYIIKQIKPIADQILSLLGSSFELTEKNAKQSKLF